MAEELHTKGEQEPPKKLSGMAYFFYYMLLFFAYWFGAQAFDQDGDGDFDPEDVQIWLAEHGWLGKKAKEAIKVKSEARRREALRKKFTRELEEKTVAEAQAQGNEETQTGTERPSYLDRDGDGDIDLDDLVNSAVEGEAQENKAMEDLMSGKVLPYFIVFECVTVFLLWFIMGIVKSGEEGTLLLDTKAGLDSFDEGMLDLRLAGPECQDYRGQVWRWLTYQFTHVGASHVLMNVFLNVMLGIPLEGIHRWWRVALMFNVGVFGGACCYMVSDAHVPVVGCSGGCYALIGIHIADLIMNWHQKRFRLPTFVMIILLIGVDVLSYLVSTDDGSKSHAAHVGGGIAGLIIGVLVCKNSHVKSYEIIFSVICFCVGLGLTAFCLGWMGTQEGGPLNIWEAANGESGWCWVKQVYDAELPLFEGLPETEHYYLCVRCGIQSCIDTWSALDHVADVSLTKCAEVGYYNV